MCKACVRRWAGIGSKMNDFFEEGFHDAVMRDMMTMDEEGMFYLFCYEQAACGFDDAMAHVIADEMFGSFLEVLDGIFGQNLS